MNEYRIGGQNFAFEPFEPPDDELPDGAQPNHSNLFNGA